MFLHVTTVLGKVNVWTFILYSADYTTCDQIYQCPNQLQLHQQPILGKFTTIRHCYECWRLFQWRSSSAVVSQQAWCCFSASASQLVCSSCDVAEKRTYTVKVHVLSIIIVGYIRLMLLLSPALEFSSILQTVYRRATLALFVKHKVKNQPGSLTARCACA